MGNAGGGAPLPVSAPEFVPAAKPAPPGGPK
jgi:hypothetical protein